MININSVTGIDRLANIHSTTSKVTDATIEQSKSPKSDELSISKNAQQLFEFENALGFSALPSTSVNRIDEITAEIESILGDTTLELSKVDKKAADQLYKQIDDFFADDVITEEEDKQLAELDDQLDAIYQKYEQPLSQKQEQKLASLFTELGDIYAELDGDDTFENVTLSDENQQIADAIVAQISQIIGIDDIELSSEDEEEAKLLNEKISSIYSNATISPAQEKQLVELNEKLNQIYQGYEKPLTRDDEEKLDTLFDQLDQLYQQ